jgi:cytochrome c-type biogenesis protein CcmH/NrfG
VAGVVVLVVVIVGAVYYFLQRSERLDLAAAELEAVQMTALMQEAPQAQEELRAYIARFQGTPYAIEAYLLLGELHLSQEQPERAIAALQEIGPAYGSPLLVQASFLLAVAFEEAERWDEAGALYRELLDRVEYSFQRREAGEGLARSELARGNLAGALQAYETVLGLLPPDDPERSWFEMRRAEVRAQAP